jgi:hypothetical protein
MSYSWVIALTALSHFTVAIPCGNIQDIWTIADKPRAERFPKNDPNHAL